MTCVFLVLSSLVILVRQLGQGEINSPMDKAEDKEVDNGLTL